MGPVQSVVTSLSSQVWSTALDFREWLGGEARINAYCQSLAVAGGKHLAKVLGTQLLDQRGELTLNMVNVELPLFNAVVDDNEVKTFLERSLLLEWNTYGACFRHNGKWWIRCCAQIWNEVRLLESI